MKSLNYVNLRMNVKPVNVHFLPACRPNFPFEILTGKPGSGWVSSEG
jgi:hypothetical protein